MDRIEGLAAKEISAGHGCHRRADGAPRFIGGICAPNISLPQGLKG